jgi:hypothetical protein
MDVENGVRERAQERRADKPHVAGQAHESDVARLELARHRPIVLVARPEFAMIDAERLDTGLPRARETRRVSAIRDDHRNRRLEAPVANGVDQRLKVAAAPRDQDAKATVHDRLV